MPNLRVFDPLFPDNFDAALRRFFSPSALDANVQPMNMRIDVTENDTGYAVKADIPGVKKEDISVRIDGNVVQIDAQTSSKKEEKSNGDKVLRSERYYGTISRTFSLADDIDENKVEAKYTDGVLSLTLPKKASAPGRKVTVQ
jgi:HSP20 family protein